MISISKRLFLFTLVLIVLTVRTADAQNTTADLARIKSATVFIMQATLGAESPVITCVGTGTIVSRDGLILTNAHNTLPGENCPGDNLIIALSIRDDDPPIPLYRADVVQADAGLDLALLRITEQTDGRVIDPASLSLPFVELADSDTVNLDSTLTVVGYPSLGDDPVTAVVGTVSGFSAEPSGGNQSWIKTSAIIPGTMSGGGAYNAAGELIGIPTTAPLAADSPEAVCLTLQDSNGDGLANANDSCVPIGGVINSLRPANFVRALLRAASLGVDIEFERESRVSTAGAGTPTFSRLFFAPSINEAGMPTTTIRSLPSGGNGLYLFFDYDNMTPETVYELRVTIDGVLNPTYGLSPVRWSGGRTGLWHVGTTEQPLPNGLYEFTLLIDGVTAATSRLLVGRSEPAPTFSDIVFGLEDTDGNVLGNGFVLPVGTTASARFIFRNMDANVPWSAIWFRENQEIVGSRTPDGTVWLDGAEGIKTIRIQAPGGLLPGTYRLDLYIDNRLASTSNFTLAGAQDGSFARIFANTRFTLADSLELARTAPPVNNVSAGESELYALFDWDRIAPGTLWTMIWSVDDEVFFEQTLPWDAAETGENFAVRVTGSSGIPDGTYRMELRMNNLLFSSQTVRVGIGQLPIDRFATTTGVQVSGRILDAYTNIGIAGASIIIITEEFSASDFTRDWRQDQVFALAVTDRDGAFQIDRLLQPEIPYSLVITAEGYLPITADGVELSLDNHPLDIPIYMTRG